ncbi:MAG TPA: hypothetical protein VGP72_16540 [Planctomycetota bacterium]|jgi:hypothetical protein
MARPVLTTSHRITLFTVLEVPYASTYNIVDAMATLAAAVEMGRAAMTSAKAQIEQYVDNDLDAGALAELITLLDDWKAASTKTSELAQGAVGDISGISFNWGTKRQTIADRIKIIVPFYRLHEVLAKQAASAGASYIQMIR